PRQQINIDNLCTFAVPHDDISSSRNRRAHHDDRRLNDRHSSKQRQSERSTAREIVTRLTSAEAHLARRLGLFDITMIVMGGIIGAGIFITPYIVAQQVPSTILILGAWTFGGLVALAGAFIYAELSSQSSVSGGQYVYLRDAFHPALAFVYGWALVLVTQSGGMAAVAVRFA